MANAAKQQKQGIESTQRQEMGLAEVPLKYLATAPLGEHHKDEIKFVTSIEDFLKLYLPSITIEGKEIGLTNDIWPTERHLLTQLLENDEVYQKICDIELEIQVASPEEILAVNDQLKIAVA